MEATNLTFVKELLTRPPAEEPALKILKAPELQKEKLA